MFRSALADFQLRVLTLSAANDPRGLEFANQRFSCAPEVPLCSRREPTSNLKPQTSNFAAKNGLCRFSSPTVVIGPCPGQMIVSFGNVRILSRLFCKAS